MEWITTARRAGEGGAHGDAEPFHNLSLARHLSPPSLSLHLSLALEH
ncbi:MAG: hypothetical protein ACK55Z_00275 [bacterium]